MNKNSTLRNTMVTFSFALLAALAPACGDDSSSAKTGGFALGANKGGTAAKTGMMAVMNGTAPKGALGGAAAPAGQAGAPTTPGGQAAAPTTPGGQPAAQTPNAGGNDPAAASALQGTWNLQEGVCALMLVFQQNRIAVLEGCQLDDGTIGVQVEEGTFTVSNGVITVTADSGSCSTAPLGTSTASFTLNGNSLTVVPQGGQSMTLTRGEPNLSGTQAVKGCLTPEGFTAQ